MNQFEILKRYYPRGKHNLFKNSKFLIISYIPIMLSDISKSDQAENKKKAFFAEENFVGGPKSELKPKLFGVSEQKPESSPGSSRVPFHQNGSSQPMGQRQSSPAIGAIQGGSIPQTGQKASDALTGDIIADSEKPQKTNLRQPSNQSLNLGIDDSFQKLYSKELDLDEDEVPLILHELNDSAIHFISRDQYDRALSLLQKAQTLLDRLMFQRNASDRFLIQCTMHNMALCFQKMGALEECSLCLDACLTQLSSPHVERLYRGDAPRKLKRLKYECKIHMQICALLSQLNRHQEALCHAKRSVQISQYMIHDLMELCEHYNQKIKEAKKREQVAQEMIAKGDSSTPLKDLIPGFEGEESLNFDREKLNKSDLIYFDEQVSMLERTAHKFNPIIQEVAKMMVKHKEYSHANFQKDKKNLNVDNTDRSLNSVKSATPATQPPYTSEFIKEKTKFLSQQSKDKTQANSINMRVLLGYLNQSEWMYLLNIGNIMQITPLTVQDLHSSSKIEIELARDSIIEKISFLAVSYFCVSTELRFLVNLKENSSVDPVQVKAESEYWHGKALEVACTFLPSESPLVSHILSSYKKHHAPVNQVIDEDKDSSDNLNLKIVRPLAGIDQCKHSPMIKSNHQMNIALSPLNLSPNNYIAKTRRPLLSKMEKAKENVPDIVIMDQSENKVKENEAKLKFKPSPGKQPPKDLQSPKQYNKLDQRELIGNENSFRKKTKDRLLDMLWQENDNDEDSFIFKDEGESSINDTIQTVVSPSEKEKLNKRKLIDEIKKDNKFDRAQDPLDSTTTVNFINMLNEVQTKSSSQNPKKQRTHERTYEKEDSRKRDNSKGKNINPEQRVFSKLEESKQTKSQDEVSQVKDRYSNNIHDFQRSLDTNPSINNTQNNLESQKHRDSIPNNEQQDTHFQKNKILQPSKKSQNDRTLNDSHRQEPEKSKKRPISSEHRDKYFVQQHQNQVLSQSQSQNQVINNENIGLYNINNKSVQSNFTASDKQHYSNQSKQRSNIGAHQSNTKYTGIEAQLEKKATTQSNFFRQQLKNNKSQSPPKTLQGQINPQVKTKAHDIALQNMYNNFDGSNKNLSSVQSQKIIDTDVQYKDSLLMMIDAQNGGQKHSQKQMKSKKDNNQNQINQQPSMNCTNSKSQGRLKQGQIIFSKGNNHLQEHPGTNPHSKNGTHRDVENRIEVIKPSQIESSRISNIQRQQIEQVVQQLNSQRPQTSENKKQIQMHQQNFERMQQTANHFSQKQPNTRYKQNTNQSQNNQIFAQSRHPQTVTNSSRNYQQVQQFNTTKNAADQRMNQGQQMTPAQYQQTHIVRKETSNSLERNKYRPPGVPYISSEVQTFVNTPDADRSRSREASNKSRDQTKVISSKNMNNFEICDPSKMQHKIKSARTTVQTPTGMNNYQSYDINTKNHKVTEMGNEKRMSLNTQGKQQTTQSKSNHTRPKQGISLQQQQEYLQQQQAQMVKNIQQLQQHPKNNPQINNKIQSHRHPTAQGYNSQMSNTNQSRGGSAKNQGTQRQGTAQGIMGPPNEMSSQINRTMAKGFDAKRNTQPANKSRNGVGGLEGSKTVQTHDNINTSHHSRLAQQQNTFNDDIAQMRNIQMQIQSKLDKVQNTKNKIQKQTLVSKNAKSAGKIHTQQSLQSANVSSRNKMHLNIVTAINTDSTNIMQVQGGAPMHAGQLQGQRSGAIQTVRNSKGPNLNHVNSGILNQQTMFVDKNSQINFQTLNSLNTSLERQVDFDQFKNPHLLKNYPGTAVGSGAIPSTPIGMSAREVQSKESLKSGGMTGQQSRYKVMNFDDMKMKQSSSVNKTGGVNIKKSARQNFN